MKENSAESTKGPVAVIAVHGVADQKKDETAEKAVDLLLHYDQVNAADGKEGHEGYEGFREEKIRVAVNPIDISSVNDDDAWHYQLGKHLEDYQPKNGKEIYESLRIEGERVKRNPGSDEPEIDRKVHVYEMHWADVSKLQIGIFNLFAAIYRLLFETSWLGKQVIGKWASFGDDVGRMSSFTSLRGLMLLLHSITTLILTRFMPVIYLLMILMLMLTGLPVLESGWAAGILKGLGGYKGLFTVSVILLVGGGLMAIASRFWRAIPWPPFYVLIVVACFLVGNIMLAFLHQQSGSWWSEAGLTVMLWLGMCLMLNSLILPALNKVFPGTRAVGRILMVFFTMGLIFGLCHKTDWPLLISGPLQALRFGSALLPFAWIILASACNLFLILAMFELFTLWFRRKPNKEAILRRRSRLRSGILSITLPVLLVSFLNAAFFQLTLVPSKIGGLDGVKPIPGRSDDAPAALMAIEESLHQFVEPVVGIWSGVPNFEEWSENNTGRKAVFSNYAKFASASMTVPFLEVIFLLIILVLGYSLWIVTPAIWTEKHHPVNPGRKKWERLSVSLGKNLTQGYRWIWFGQVALVVCLLATQALFAFRGMRASAIRNSPDQGANDPPHMVLVDMFLGLRASEEDFTEVAASSSRYAPSAERRFRRPSTREVAEPEGTTIFQRDYDSKRERVRRSVEEFWEQRQKSPEWRDDYRRRTDRSPRPAPTPPPAPDTEVDGSAASVPAPAVVVPPTTTVRQPGPTLDLSIFASLLTEMVVFLNSGPLTSALGFAILAIGLGYLFFARIADPFVAGLRGGLDVALDVVTYLHPFPKNRTARAQILNRYASLLQYITEWRDPLNPEQGYSRIVIVAHSQGSVISSDVLRTLSAGTVAKDNGLDMLREDPNSKTGIPVRLITMGSPLVQLYQARFPDLYAWDKTADPRLNHRGLECWWNLYRSGDYVGRMIFRDPKDKASYIPEENFVLKPDGQPVPVFETCIGPGAHTHYWGENAPVSVIRKIDSLISEEEIHTVPEGTSDEVEQPI
ncbi:MAG: hypothetical protein P1V20_25915 [Verrucomicrobiales bacterium]|nr:hypothetical protein [Verrucomicrobiales bacterium]